MDHYLNTVVRYIPMDRRQAMANGAVLGDRASGAVLFADISGFTPLTAALYQDLSPQRGAEELDHLLNLVFDALIGRVHNFHGSVIGFSGDAITCWFDGDNGLWATACALEMQQVVDQIGSVNLSGGSTLTLAVKATAATGRVRRLVAGDPQIQRLDVIAGAAIDRAAAAEKVASRGDVIVTPEIRAALGARVLIAGDIANDAGQTFSAVADLSSPVEGRPWLDLPQNDLDQVQLQPWLLPEVYELLNTGHSQFLAELRHTVALFLKFEGLDYDNDPAVGDKLDQYIRWVQGIVAHYGGSLMHLTMGDKGSYLLVAFGAPVAHEDDPRRAVVAALDLISLPEALDFIQNVRVGVSQGIMFSGAYGGSERRTYGIQGEETNIAARLMEQAGVGQVLVTTRIADATVQNFDYADLEPVSVKGVAEPVEICLLLNKRDWRTGHLARQIETEMVGRAEERRLLEEQLRKLLRGEDGGVIIVEGEAGIGKSRLLEDLMQQAQELGVSTFLGEGDAIEKNAAYYSWRMVFWDLFDLDSPSDAEPPGVGRLSEGQRDLTLEHLHAAVPDAQQLTPLLNAVLPIDLPENKLTEQMSGAARGSKTQDLLVALLQARAAAMPLLLILEDAHWLDSASWSLTRLVSRDVASMMLVIATRPLPDPLPTEYTALLRRRDTHHLALVTLPSAEALQLVRLRLGVEQLPEPVIELLLEKASGHPFFSEELAYALRDSGLIVIENGQSRLTASVEELNALSFPDSIDSVITSRIDLLTARQQLTLKVASVIGRVFAFRTLFDIHPIEANKPDLHDQLNTLERLDITSVETPEAELSYIFKHIITQEVAYKLMSFAQRQGLHQAIAEWLENIYSEDLSPYYALLSYHYQQALGDQFGRTDLAAKTIEYLEKAADRSLDNFANREAVAFYSELLRLDDLTGNPADTLSRARWQRGLGEANYRLGEWKMGSEQLEAALALLGHPIPSGNIKLAFKLSGQILKQVYYRLRFSDLPTKSNLDQRQLEILLEATHSYRTLSISYLLREELSAFVYSGVYNANLVQKLGVSSELLEAFATLTATLGSVPRQPFANSYMRQALAMSDDSDDFFARAWTSLTIGAYMLETGAWVEGLQLLEQGCAFCEQLGHRRLWEENWALSAVLLCRWGKFKDSIGRWQDVYASANRRDDPQPQVFALSGLVENALWTDEEFHESQGHLQEALEHLAAKNVSLNDHVRTHGLLAIIHVRHGNQELARQEADIVLDLMNQSNVLIPYTYDGYVAPVDVYLALWEKEDDRTGAAGHELARFARKGLKTARSLGRTYPIFQPRGWYYQGRYNWLSGKQNKAKKAWRKSISLARELDMPHEEGLAHYEYGRHLAADDPEREVHLMRALELFSNCGANYYTDLAREELNSAV